MYIIKRYNGDESIRNGNKSVGHESWSRMGHRFWMDHVCRGSMPVTHWSIIK